MDLWPLCGSDYFQVNKDFLSLSPNVDLRFHKSDAKQTCITIVYATLFVLLSLGTPSGIAGAAAASSR